MQRCRRKTGRGIWNTSGTDRSAGANDLGRRLHRSAADPDADGRVLATLADARAYLLALPQREQAQDRLQAAATELLKAAEHGGPFLFIARVAMSRAVHGVSGVGPMPSRRVTKQDKC